ncbi:MAG: hypothetical protein ACUVQF_08265 [Fervidobacterium sp.]|uniref:hypothetical protein n=1 Tax=Fervidobacterium sp. TaxID=1871331 RepID=UPI0040496D62
MDEELYDKVYSLKPLREKTSYRARYRISKQADSSDIMEYIRGKRGILSSSLKNTPKKLLNRSSMTTTQKKLTSKHS